MVAAIATPHVRHADDFYRTPAEVTRQCIRKVVGWRINGLSVLDPSAGDGAILDVAKEFGARGVGLEIDGGRALAAAAKGHVISIADALMTSWPEADLLIGNPPFSYALEFATRAAEWSRRHERQAALLLRLAFLESVGRVKFHREYPADVHVLAKRPSFTENGKSDSCAYAWFVWSPGIERGRVRILEAP